MDTIFALSSGAPPAAIGIVRVSGPNARQAMLALAGKSAMPRHATVASIRHPDSNIVLDRALLLWFPGPASATGDDVLELHCHGGRAVIRALDEALAALPGLRRALPGEFTRRALENGRIDLAQAEGLGDLLAAETESQRRAALSMHEGHFSQSVEGWRQALLQISAMVEAALDFSDEDDVPERGIEREIAGRIAALRHEIVDVLARPSAERLRDGVRVVIAGPPNSGKSSLLNRLVGREAAIVSAVPGTTRDRIDVPVTIVGVPFLLTDTAGLRNVPDDEIEAIGIARAGAAMATADVLLWLGDPADMPDGASLVISKIDRSPLPMAAEGLAVSAHTGQGIAKLNEFLLQRARQLLPAEGDYALNQRQRGAVAAVAESLTAAADEPDLLIVAEELRQARVALDRVTGRSGSEDMLDALFAGFCIGK